MKLALVFLLLIPAFHCSFVSDLCEKTDKYMRIGLFGTDGELRDYVSQYTKDKELLDAVIKLNTCVSHLSKQEKINYYEMSMKRMAYCESPKL